jgi:enamine deaminase RidA (YjgF/YER057c/UK114 family)
VRGLVFVSGQIALNQKPAKRKEPSRSKPDSPHKHGSIRAAGSGLDLVVKTTACMADMNDFADE